MKSQYYQCSLFGRYHRDHANRASRTGFEIWYSQPPQRSGEGLLQRRVRLMSEKVRQSSVVQSNGDAPERLPYYPSAHPAERIVQQSLWDVTATTGDWT